MSQNNDKDKKNRVTKEASLLITPIIAAYLFIVFYEAGFSSFYGVPHDLIVVNITDVILTNRFTLIVAVLAFFWIGLYYNLLPSANSPIFRGMITFILIFAIWLGFTLGRTDAIKKEDYLTISGNPQQIVVKIYGKNVITVPFDPVTRTFQKKFSAHKIGTDESIVYKQERVGPLTPK